jgi:hypothetical protein
MNELSSLIPAVLRKMQLTQQLTEDLVFSLWRSAVGDLLARNTKPFRLIQATLIVHVPSQTWKQQLYALRFEILRKLEQLLGRERVLALEFRVDPHMKSVEAPEETSVTETGATVQLPVDLPVETIADSELGRTLAAAAASYLSRSR